MSAGFSAQSWDSKIGPLQTDEQDQPGMATEGQGSNRKYMNKCKKAGK